MSTLTGRETTALFINVRAAGISASTADLLITGPRLPETHKSFLLVAVMIWCWICGVLLGVILVSLSSAQKP